MKPESEYTPWPGTPVAAWLDWGGEPRLPNSGRLWFLDPDGRNAMVHVQRDAITDEGRYDPTVQQHVWRIVEHEDGTATVSPSIHFIGHFHTPRPVRFELVGSRAEALTF